MWEFLYSETRLLQILMLHGFLIWHVWGMCYWVVVPLGEFPYLGRCAIERCAIGHCAIRRYLCGLPVGGLECGRCVSENVCEPRYFYYN